MDYKLIGYSLVDTKNTNALFLLCGMVVYLIINLVLVSILITKFLKKIKRVTYQDILTKLGNRKSIYKYLNEFDVEKKYGILFLDIDNFKSINDKYGHSIGDLVLIHLANILKSFDGIPARLGGEEFVVVLNEISEVDFIKKGEELLKKIRTCSFNNNDINISITVSIGTAYANNLFTWNHILKEADVAMYQSKKTGKNKITHSKDLNLDILNIENKVVEK